MGCGASAHDSQWGLGDELDEDKKNGKGKPSRGIVGTLATSKKDREADDAADAALALRAVSRARLESKYPWETDNRPIPEDVCIVFVLGPPGSGKSTQCQKLVAKNNYAHLSSGDLLREEVEGGTALGNWVKDLMDKGQLVPSAITMTLLKKAMLKTTSHVMLIDGFPRSVEQLHLFERSICACHQLLYLDVSKEVAEQRISQSSSGAVAGLEEAFQTFREQTIPVRDHYSYHGKAAIVDASRSPEAVFAELDTIVQAAVHKRDQELHVSPAAPVIASDNFEVMPAPEDGGADS